MEKCQWCERTLRRRLDKLTEYGHIDKSVVKMDDRIRPFAVYKKSDIGDMSEIPSWNELLKLNAEGSSSIRTHKDNNDNNDTVVNNDKKSNTSTPLNSVTIDNSKISGNIEVIEEIGVNDYLEDNEARRVVTSLIEHLEEELKMEMNKEVDRK